MTTMQATGAPDTGTGFVGTYELDSFEIRKPDGTVAHPLGPDAAGRLSYDAEGRMAVQVMRRDRPAFASGDLLDGTPEEVDAAWSGFIAYAGRYRVDDEAGSVTHVIDVSSFPNWVGTEQTRYRRFAGDTLELTTPPTAYGGSGVVAALVWRRV